ncbi:hypothetical protein ACFFWE_29300 [Sphaerisporangium melleum]|uniref:hypothetical protein n=1 Tax=Sphaerisporangium melleum TaxID=321316 RepID=UPI0016631753|nr:hypothetical protein [Sphaerisporangium melleum]
MIGRPDDSTGSRGSLDAEGTHLWTTADRLPRVIATTTRVTRRHRWSPHRPYAAGRAVGLDR